MRTTLTIDDDVAVGVERLRRERDASLKDVINDLLRRALHDAAAPPKPRKPFHLKTFNGGQQLIPLDNVAEAIALLEGENYK